MDATALSFVVGAYLVGSIPTGVLLARWTGRPDPREGGSGNVGATNVARTLGYRLGVLTLLGDLAKGLVPVLAGRSIGLTGVTLSLVGLAAVLGHVASIFLRFEGGKGVATGLGAFLGLCPGPTGVAVAVFAIVVGATRFVSLASVLATLTVPVAAALMPGDRVMAPAGAAVAALIVYRHRANLSRLVRGEEPRFGRKRDPEAAGADADAPAQSLGGAQEVGRGTAVGEPGGPGVEG